MLIRMATPHIHPFGFYLNGSLWLIALVMVGFAVRSLAHAATVRSADLPESLQVSSVASSGAAATPARQSIRIYDVRDLVQGWSASPESEPGA